MTDTLVTAYRWRWLALVAVLAAEIMDLIDGTVVGIAAPSIRAELGGGDAMIQWVAAGYTLAFAAGLITGGRLGDLYGRRRMFLLGLIGFVAASALCGLATSPGMLIGFRVAQGLLGAMLIPQGFGILKATFPPDDLGKAFGAFGPTIGLAVVGAPILGGALIAWDVAGLGWRTIFLINVPLGLAALALAAAVLPESRAEDGPRPTRSGWCWCRPASRCWCSRSWRAASWAGPRGRSVIAGRGGRAARRLRRAPGAAQPGGPGTAGRARAVPTADVHRGDGGGAGVVRGHHRARAGAGPLPPARAGLHAARGGAPQAPWALGSPGGRRCRVRCWRARLGRAGLQIGAVVAAAGLRRRCCDRRGRPR